MTKTIKTNAANRNEILAAAAKSLGMTTELFLKACEIESKGPTRVVTKVEGGHVAEALTPAMAGEMGIIPDFFVIRNDGWSLVFRACDRTAALKLWAGSWIHEGKFT
jgi:hypothetical protein